MSRLLNLTRQPASLLTLGLLLALLLPLSRVRAEESPAGTLLLEGFEEQDALERWYFQEAAGQLATARATEGVRSARISFGAEGRKGPELAMRLPLDQHYLPGNDYLPFDRLAFDVYNETGKVIELRAGLRDTLGNQLSYRTFSIPPRSGMTCELPTAHLFKHVPQVFGSRGEKEEQPPKILSFYLLLVERNELYLDNLRLVASPLEVREAGLGLDPFQAGRVLAGCRLNRAAACDLRIMDDQGRIVARHYQLTDLFRWSWESETDRSTLAPGSYTARLTVADVRWNPDRPIVRELGSFQVAPERERPELVAWHEPTTRQVMLSDRPQAGQPVLTWEEIAAEKPELAPLRIEMARGEVEGAQLVFLTRSRTARLGFAIEGLSHTRGGMPFPLEGGEILQVGYVLTRDPLYYEVDHIGWWPDALLPNAQMYAEPQECMPVWVNLRSDRETVPGLYRGRLAITLNGERAGSIPLEVTVHPPVLPESTTIRTAFTTSDELIAEVHGGKLPPGMLRRYHQFVADHRLNPDNIYRSRPPELETVEYFAGKDQLNAFNLKYIGGRVEMIDQIDNEAYLQELADDLDPYVAELRRRGLADKAYFYGFDEIGGEMYEVVRRTFGFLKKRYPEIPTMTTGRDASFGIDSGLEDEVDIWVPLTPVYDLQRADATRKRGKEVWWYICISPPHPYANWFVEYPALEPRLLWWMTWQQRVPGFLYYLTNLRHGQEELMRLDGHNKTNWNPASWRTANGDGCFIYSGPEGPISTIRFENIRDGLEDSELLFLLERRLKDGGRAGQALCGELIRSLTDYCRDPAQFAEVRRRLLQQAGGRTVTRAVGGGE